MNSIFKECIIAGKIFDSGTVLIKNRDRTYIPFLVVYRIIKKDFEVVILYDQVTGWAEGMNSDGVGIVNTALIVDRDELEDIIVKQTGKKSVDGKIIIKALQKRKFNDIIKTLATYEGGLKGHTFVADRGKLFRLERTLKNYAIKQIDKNTLVVRSNHGYEFKKSGYQDGNNYLSSYYRMNQAIEVLNDADPENWPKLLRIQKYDPTSSLNMARESKLFTSSQLFMNLGEKSFHLYLINKKVKFAGIRVINPKKHKDKSLIDIYIDWVDITKHQDFIDPIKKV
jgi:hypothetical protein